MYRNQFLKSLGFLSASLVLGSWSMSLVKSNKTIKMKKKINKKADLNFKNAFPGLRGVDMMAHTYPIEPILVFTEYNMDKPVFGPHPHAGISVMTYMLPDSAQGFINRDSLGDNSYIEPGGLHISQAGRGMFHDEFPKVSGVDTHGFQIWINHKETDRWVSPKAMHANSNEVTEVLTSQYKVRVVHGSFEGKQSVHQMVTPVDILHVFLEPNTEMILPAKEMAFVYGLSGSALLDDVAAKPQTLITFEEDGDHVIIKTGAEKFEFMYCTATPLREPIVYGGPFVMTTQEQMQITQQRLANGEMEGR